MKSSNERKLTKLWISNFLNFYAVFLVFRVAKHSDILWHSRKYCPESCENRKRLLLQMYVQLQRDAFGFHSVIATTWHLGEHHGQKHHWCVRGELLQIFWIGSQSVVSFGNLRSHALEDFMLGIERFSTLPILSANFPLIWMKNLNPHQRCCSTVLLLFTPSPSMASSDSVLVLHLRFFLWAVSLH